MKNMSNGAGAPIADAPDGTVRLTSAKVDAAIKAADRLVARLRDDIFWRRPGVVSSALRNNAANYIEWLHARIRELKAEREWKPIDDAAKNAKRVDLLGNYGKKRKRVPDCYWHRKAERWMTSHHDDEGYSALRLPFEPTHYRLLPKEWPNGQPRSGVAPDPSAPKEGE